MSGSATENSILLSLLPRLNKIFNQSINGLYMSFHIYSVATEYISCTAKIT